MSEKQSKSICVVTGTRAEYGLLSGTMHKIEQHKELNLQLVVCAAHLSEKHGMTVNEIIHDGFAIDARVPMLEEENSDLAIAHSVAKGIAGFADSFAQLNPDCVLVLGDRFEILAAVQAALFMHIPIAHIHGGEVTEGAIDEAIRHAITKMSNLHFAAAEAYRQRIIQMGENPALVFNVGAPGVDKIAEFTPLAKSVLEEYLSVNLSEVTLLVTYHPETWGEVDAIDALNTLLSVLQKLNANIIWTGANADSGGDRINQTVKQWFSQNKIKGGYYNSLGFERYLSLLHYADAVIGNSSSGIIEAPAVGVPTVNIGNRQAGRLRSESVIDCHAEADEIGNAINKALSKTFKAQIKLQTCAYGVGGAADKIVKTLVDTDLKSLKSKQFYDLN